MDNNNKSSLFDYFQEKIRNEQLQCSISNDEKSVDGVSRTDEGHLTINQNTDLNEYSNYDLMVSVKIRITIRTC